MTKYLNLEGLTYYKAKEDLLLANKVDKENGKGLSSNDYTGTEKTKLSGIETGAQVNILEGIQLNGTSISPTNKIVNINALESITSSDVVTALGYTPYNSTNPNNYIDANAITTKENITNKVTSIGNNPTDIEYPSALAVKSYVTSAVASITGISYEIVQTLPASGQNGVIYLVPNSGSSPNSYDEYIWLSSSSSFEKIGTTAVDLTNYVQFSDLVAITTTEIDTLFA